MINDLKEELTNNNLSPSHKESLEIQLNRQIKKVTKYEIRFKENMDQQVLLSACLQHMSRNEDGPISFKYCAMNYDYFSKIDFRLAGDIFDFSAFKNHLRGHNSPQLIYFDGSHRLAGLRVRSYALVHLVKAREYYIENLWSHCFENQRKLIKIQTKIWEAAKLLRYVMNASELSLENEIKIRELQKEAEKTKKSISQLLKEKIESLNEDANDIYIPLLAPSYYFLLVLIEFQKEAPLHKIRQPG
ncbi:MAG: hypothetical protein FJX03_07205 [Alphaproteobacteria bacterium]|nr:hypothetical protein [Alphaproteobacteria bacterium]